jgi:C-terminal processing protease CtpA/Prc
MVTLAFLLLATLLCNSPFALPGESREPSTLTPRQLDNLAAFTKLYGYVRFFHPSDEAAELDWNKFAIYGAGRVVECKTRGELMSELYRLFSPVAPSILIYGSRIHPPDDLGRFVPTDTSGLKLVAWQHLGVGLSERSVYQSIRLNRTNTGPEGNGAGFGAMTGKLDPSPLRGKRITLKASVKAERGSQGQLWLRVDRPGGKMGFFDNMDDRPIVSTEWKPYEITGIVDSDAVNIGFGCILLGSGKVWVDDVRLLSGEDYQRENINLANFDFEMDTTGAIPRGWLNSSPGYAVEVTLGSASAGAKSVIMKSTPGKLPSELFPERPAPGDVISCDLPDGISVRLPLVLFADSTGTLPQADRYALEDLNKKLESSMPKSITGREPSVRLGDIVIAWNVFRHFYPYFDLAGVNWENELRPALQEAGRDTTEIEYLRTLQKFVAKLGDGHGGAWLPSDKSGAFFPPIQWTWAEDKLVITAVYDTSADMPSVGDVVVEINGQAARKAIEQEEVFTSAATPQWKRLRAIENLLHGPENSTAELTVANREGQKQNFALARTVSWTEHRNFEQARQRPTEEIGDGIYYVNISNTSMARLDSLMPDLAKARGVICDLRGYPTGNHGLISHLLTAPDTSTHWMGVPRVIYPDQQKSVGYDYEGWELQPKAPHLNGTVVFLTDGRAISYAESYMSFIEHYKLAEIVGEPTAGTNGNVNPLSLPGGYHLTWTGMRVTKQDGSRLHGVGIQPTVPVHPTIKGIREGRDEQLDVAVSLVNNTPRQRDLGRETTKREQ